MDDQKQQSSKSRCESDGFYVGYLPAPDRHRRFLIQLIPILLVFMIGVGWLIAAGQRDPGASFIQTGEIEHWTGTLFVEPYPMLIADSGDVFLITGIGKFGVAERVRPFDGVRCSVDGWRLSRSGRSAIQLDPADNAIVRDPSGELPASKPTLEAQRSVRLVGEIVDGKCYIGAMKPGDGKAHKACAILCVEGGLPPLFSSNDPVLAGVLPLVLVDGSTELSDSIIELVGEPVLLEGELCRFGSLLVLRTSSTDLHRVKD